MNNDVYPLIFYVCGDRIYNVLGTHNQRVLKLKEVIKNDNKALIK